MAVAFAIFISVVVPLLLCVYAIIKRQAIPFALGIIAFTLSQIAIRIPLLGLLAKNMTAYTLLQTTSPILFLALIALSAGIFEETARWLAMKLFMKRKGAMSAIYFGFGHGGIEALLLVGLPYIVQFSLVLTMKDVDLYLSGVERICGIIVHVYFSIIVFYSVREHKPIYYILAIGLHGAINFIVAFLATSTNAVLAEIVFVILTGLLILFCKYLMRGMLKNEKKLINSIN